MPQSIKIRKFTNYAACFSQAPARKEHKLETHANGKQTFSPSLCRYGNKSCWKTRTAWKNAGNSRRRGANISRSSPARLAKDTRRSSSTTIPPANQDYHTLPLQPHWLCTPPPLSAAVHFSLSGLALSLANLSHRKQR